MAEWSDQSPSCAEVVALAFLSLTSEFTYEFDEENSETVK